MFVAKKPVDRVRVSIFVEVFGESGKRKGSFDSHPVKPLRLELILRRNNEEMIRIGGYDELALMNVELEGSGMVGGKDKKPLMITSGQNVHYNLELVCDLDESYPELTVYL